MVSAAARTGSLVLVDPPSGSPSDSRRPAQLLAYRSATSRWLALTLDGETLFVSKDNVQLVGEGDLGGLDAVMGPKSEAETVVRGLSTSLAEKGYATMATILPKEHLHEMHDVSRGLEAVGKFSRLPIGVEEAYLGRGSSGKVCYVDPSDPDTPMTVSKSEFAAQDRSINMLGEMIAPHLEDLLGIRIVDRTRLLLHVPFRDLEDQARHLQGYPSASEADAFLADMARRRLCALQFLGPSSGTLHLHRKVSAGKPLVLDVAANQMVLFLTSEFEHTFVTDGESLVLQTFFQEQALSYKTTTVSGPTDLFSLPAVAPKAPSSMNTKVVSLASRDPCNADSEEKYWTAVRHAGCDGFLEIPYTRFDVDTYINYLDQTAAVFRGQSYCRHQGHLEGIDFFDYKFFNIPVGEAQGMDPEQRVVLETAWGAMAGAGYELAKLRREPAHYGCYVGISQSDWQAVTQDLGLNAGANGVPETFIANRVNFLFNLKGPSFIQNTACSASLVATHNAKTALANPHDPLDGCLAVGVSLNTGYGTWIGNCSGNMLSFIGRCFTFDSSADGYGRGEGSASLVMQRGRYSRDDLFPGISGTHVNSDGRSATITAPNGPAQQRLLRAVMSESGVKAGSVDVYEAHGTGTMLGDPIELGAVKKVMQVDRTQPLLTTCAKTNTGHMEGGAGISGFLKCCLMVMHGECGPNQHLRLVNPNLDTEGFPQYLITDGVALQHDTAYIGVSSFGYGGTNAHCQAFGHNALTSRGMSDKFLDKQVARKFFSAAAPLIDMSSSNWEEWKTDGVPHLTGSLDKVYDVELTSTNRAIWREVVEPELCSYEGPYYLTGSFNDWEMLEMQPSEEVPHLFAAKLRLLDDAETFQIVLQQDPSLTFFPAEEQCVKRAADVRGPDVQPSKDVAWLIKGKPGDIFIVEFYNTPEASSVTWFRRRNDVNMVSDVIAAE